MTKSKPCSLLWMSRMKKILEQMDLPELFFSHLLGVLAPDVTYPGNMCTPAGAVTSFSWMPGLWGKSRRKDQVALQGSHHRQCFGFSKQPVRVQLHSAESLKNEHCACSLEFFSVFPGTFSTHMQTRWTEKLQETSICSENSGCSKQVFFFNASVLESPGKTMKRRQKEEIRVDSKV